MRDQRRRQEHARTHLDGSAESAPGNAFRGKTEADLEMKIILTAREPQLADAWEKFCGDIKCVSVHRGSILDLTCDAIVSPANSYGFMDGGLDALYIQRLGWQLEERLRRQIMERHQGELL